MKNLRKHQLIAIGSSIAVLYGALCLVAFASAASRTEKPAPVDAEQYADFMGHEVLDIQDLAEGAEVQRRMFNRITPPGLSWIQPMFPPVAPFDAENFDERFLSELLGEEKNSVAIYPLSLIQNPKTRETLIYNAEGELIAAIPADRGSREWPADADPSRVILQLGLLPAEDVEPYLYTERRIEESLARYNAPRSAKSGGAATRGLEAGEFGICGIQGTTNGTMFITVTNGANVAEVFAYTVWHTSSVVVVTWTNEQSNVVTDTNTVWHQVSPAFNGLESAWECLTTNLVLTNGVGVYENANISSNARIRFYAVANRQDTDGDGLTDGAEIFVHHTNPGNPDTDGDGWSDAEELAAGTEPLDRFSATKLARDVVLNEVLYNATGPDLGYEWIELYCAGRYPVNLGDFVIQVADTAYSNAYVFPSNTWIEPGRFLLLGGSNVPNRDLEVNFQMPNRFTNDPTAAVRIVAETGTNTVVVDCLMYGGSASNFNPYGLDTTGWISSHALSAGAGRSLYRRFNGHDTDQVWDWWYTENPTPNPFADISDSDGDGLTDAEELTGSRNPYGEPTNPHNADSDGDGLSDYAECITHGTNPNTWATDDDIYPWPPPSGAASDWWGSDSYEIANGWDPLNPDENTNGIPDSWEMAFPGTDLYGHADNDGISNFDELMQNSNPNDPNSATPQPYVLRYEPSMPGWANSGMTDIGLEGWVKVYFENLKSDATLCLWVTEGNVQEEFHIEWLDAESRGTFWLDNNRTVVTSADVLDGMYPCLLVQDAGQRPDFTGKLGGEYKIAVIKVDLDIRETALPQNRVGRDDPRILERVSNRILVWANSGANTITFDLIKPPDITSPVWIQIEDQTGLNSGMPHFERLDGASKTFTYNVANDNDNADLLVRYGVDLNSDGTLSGTDEIKGTFEVYGVTAAEYADSRYNYNWLYLPFALFDLADQLHKRFANGAFGSGDFQPTTTSGSATLSATRLTHYFGANLADAGFVTLGGRQYYSATATFPIYHYADNTDASELIRQSSELKNGLNAFVASLSYVTVAAAYAAAPGGATRPVTFSLNGRTFQFGATGSIGLGGVGVNSAEPYSSAGTITLQITLNGSNYVIGTDATIDLTVHDIFDFDYFTTGWIANYSDSSRSATMIQNGFGKTGSVTNAGQVGLLEVEVDGSVSITGRTVTP